MIRHASPKPRAPSASNIGRVASEIEALCGAAYWRGWHDAIDAVIGTAQQSFVPVIR
jgi:hypothetical protein